MPNGPDAQGRDEPPATSLSAPRGASPDPRLQLGPEFVAPLTIGRPAWQRHHLRCTVAVHAGAVGCAAVLLLLGRGAVAPVAGALVAAAGRAALGWRLRHLRRRGRATSALLGVGAAEDLALLVARTRAAPGLGWRVVAVCTSTGAGLEGASHVAGVPVAGDLDAVAGLVRTGRYDAVSVTPVSGWTARRLQQLAAVVDGTGTALLVDPRMVRRTGPRLRVTGVDGLPLLRLEHPTLAGPRRLVKETMDRACAATALVLVAPILLSCAVAARRDGGPALRRHTCLGHGGREFALLTFRTVDDAGAVTPVGRILRRHGLYGLPQLLNVLGGSMALVGPRPPVAGDGTERLPVKPGLTGLPQPRRATESGEGAEADPAEPHLHYVERWTPSRDARILLHSLGVFLRH